jgi:hypothetical protein
VLLSRAQEDIRHGLKSSMSVRQVRDLIDSVLYSILYKHKPGPNDGSPIDILVGVRVKGMCRLYESDQSAMLGPVKNNRTCLGWGSSLGLFYADSLFRKNMTMKGGEIIAAHLIRQAKRYADGCGGRTHILRVPTNGPVVKLEQPEIRSMEGYFAEVDKAMAAMLPVPALTDEAQKRGLLSLAQAMHRTRSAAYQGPVEMYAATPLPLRQSTVTGEWLSAAIAAGDIPSASPKPEKPDGSC